MAELNKNLNKRVIVDSSPQGNLNYPIGHIAVDSNGNEWEALSSENDWRQVKVSNKSLIIREVDSVASLKLLNDVKLGDKIKTSGYYNNNPNGKNTYTKISEASTGYIDDGGFIIIGDNDNVYQADVVNNTMSLMQFGAKGDGIEGDENAGDDSVAYENCIKWQDLDDKNTMFIDTGVFNTKQKIVTLDNELRIVGKSKYTSILTNCQSILYSKSVYVDNFKVSYCQDTILITPYKYKNFLMNESTSSSDGDYDINITHIRTNKINKFLYQNCTSEDDMPVVRTRILDNDFKGTATGVITLEGEVKDSFVNYNSIYDIIGLENALKDVNDISYSNCGSNIINNPENDTSYAYTGFILGKQNALGVSKSSNIEFKGNRFDKVLIGRDWRNTEAFGESSCYAVLAYANNCTTRDNQFLNCERSLYLRGSGNKILDNLWLNDEYNATNCIIWKSRSNYGDEYVVKGNKFIGKIWSTFLLGLANDCIIEGNEYRISNEHVQVIKPGGVESEIGDKCISFDEIPVENTSFRFKNNKVYIEQVVDLNFISLSNTTSRKSDVYIEDNEFLGVSGGGYKTCYLRGDSSRQSSLTFKNNKIHGNTSSFATFDRINFEGNIHIKKDGVRSIFNYNDFIFDRVNELSIINNNLRNDGGAASNRVWRISNTLDINYKNNKCSGDRVIYFDDYNTVNSDVLVNIEGSDFINTAIHFDEGDFLPTSRKFKFKINNNNLKVAAFTFDNGLQDRRSQIDILEWNNNSINTLFTYYSTVPNSLEIFNDFTVSKDSNIEFISAADILSVNTTPVVITKSNRNNNNYSNDTWYHFLSGIRYRFKERSAQYTGDIRVVLKGDVSSVEYASFNIDNGSVDGFIDVNENLDFKENIILTTNTSDPLDGDGELFVECIYDYNFISNASKSLMVNKQVSKNQNNSKELTSDLTINNEDNIGKYIYNNSADNRTVTVEDFSSNKDFEIDFAQLSTGSITFVEGAGVTIVTEGTLVTNGVGAAVTLKKITDTLYHLIGSTQSV